MSISKNNYNELKKRFGQYASFTLWADPDTKPSSNTADLSVFDLSKHPTLLDQLNTGYVFVGLNAAEHDQPVEDWRSFHSSYRHQKDFKLRYALNHDDRFRGSYITDVIKGWPETDSQKVMRSVKRGDIDIMKHLQDFQAELDLLSPPRPILIALGKSSYEILQNLSQGGYTIYQIAHYSDTHEGRGNPKIYSEHVREVLKNCPKLT